MKEGKQVLIMVVFIGPKVSVVLSELTVNNKNESGE
jgi:hypothetical protein